MNLIGICLALVLLFIANSVPVLVKNVLGNRFDAPLDGGRLWFDGQPIFGASKTLRGLIASVTACALCGAVLGLPIGVAAAAGAAAMAGDLLSSFLKRRLQIAPSGRAVALGSDTGGAAAGTRLGEPSATLHSRHHYRHAGILGGRRRPLSAAAPPRSEGSPALGCRAAASACEA